MHIVTAIQLGLFRLADISVKPNPSGLPGTAALEKLVNGLAVGAASGGTKPKRKPERGSALPSETTLITVALVHHLDIAANTGGASQRSVCRQEQGVQCLGQRNVGCVVGAEVVAQLPNARQERQVRNPPQWKRRQVDKRLSGAPLVESTGTGCTPKGGDDLQVDQLGCCQLLASHSVPRPIAILPVVREGRRHHRGVDDNHTRSRSTRNVSAAKASPSEPPERPPARSSTSFKVSS